MSNEGLEKIQDYTMRDGVFLTSHNDVEHIHMPQPLRTDELRGSQTKYVCVRDCPVYFQAHGKKHRLVIKEGNESDGASVPAFLCDALVPPHLIRVPAFFHDAGYRGAHFEEEVEPGVWKAIPRNQHDFDIFLRAHCKWWLELMKHVKGDFISFLTYRGVDVGGHLHFQS